MADSSHTESLLAARLELARERALLILRVSRETHRSVEDRLSQIEGEAEHFYFVATGMEDDRG